MNLTLASDIRIAPTSKAAIDSARAVAEFTSELPQINLVTHHVLHAGMYARTIRMPADTVITGALIKIPTVLILSGDATVISDETIRLSGYGVIPASAHRKQVFIAHADTDLTMIFPTNAKTVEEAEAEFTDEVDLLISRARGERDVIIITGE